MSFSQSQVNSKLDSLQETQDSIVSISQWILFHQKHYQESIKLWSDYFHRSSLSSTKKLSLLYLCNDIVQQARRKNKPEFNNEFAKVLPDALRISYSELKPKIDRLLNVWQDRKIFTTDQITNMKQTLETSTRTKKKQQQQQQHEEDDNDNDSGNQFKGGQISSEIKFVNDLYLRVDQLTKSSQGNLTQLGIQSKIYLNSKESDNLPDSSTYISKLNMLEKLGIFCISNIEEIKKIKLQIKSQLDNLSQLISDGIDTENVKIDAINDKLTKLKETRDELNNIGTQIDDYGQQVGEEQEEEDEDGIPGYEPDSDSDSDSDDNKDNDDVNESRKRRLSQTSSSGASTPSKKVAFSESIEVFEGEDQNEQEQEQVQDEQVEGEQVQDEQVTESVDVFSLLSKLAE